MSHGPVICGILGFPVETQASPSPWPLKATHLAALTLPHSTGPQCVSRTFHQSLEHSVLHLSLLKTQYHGNYAARFCCQPRMELSPIGPWCQQLCALVLGEVLLAATFDSRSFKGILSLGPLLINGFAFSQCRVIYGWDLAPESSFLMQSSHGFSNNYSSF